MPSWLHLTNKFDPLKGKQFRIIDDEGNVIAKEYFPLLSVKILLQTYKDMLRSRLGDAKMLSLQRQGRMGTFAPSEGQEGAQAGSILALKQDQDPEKSDWIVPAFREFPAALMRGVPMENLFMYWAGYEIGTLGHKENCILPPTIPVGSQCIHGVGLAYALKLKMKRNVALVYFGDGATSEGDFHEAMNFAGVFKTPTIFLCQNNQWAISVPRKIQTATATLAQKALAYGFEGLQVDGNDIFAIYVATAAAREHAIKFGPTMIEAYTYRLGNHTTADNAKIYRDDKEVEKWRKSDPIKRLRLYLEKNHLWDGEKEKALTEEIKKEIEKVTEKLKNAHKQNPEEIFNYMYEELTWELKDQQKYLKQFYKNEE